MKMLKVSLAYKFSFLESSLSYLYVFVPVLLKSHSLWHSKMAEAFGIVAGSIGIATAFNSCLDCFRYIKLGRRLGRDLQTDLLVLNGVWLRLSRWGQAVNINQDPNLGRPDAKAEEIQEAYDSVFQILVLFSESARISKSYIESKPNDDLTLITTSNMDSQTSSLANWIRTCVSKRQSSRGFLKASSWALYHRTALRELLADINRLIDVVEKLFPAPEARLNLARQEISEIPNQQSVGLLLSAMQDSDPALLQAAKDPSPGHSYWNITTEGEGMSLAGDEFADGWTQGAIGKDHTFNGITTRGKGISLLGNRYGGESVFKSRS
jgi:Prion-inhibition and propagation